MNYLIHPITNEKISLFSSKGKQLLKYYIISFQNGGSVEGGATKSYRRGKLSQRQKQLIKEGRENLIKFTEKAIGPLQNDDEGRNSLRRIMELINTGDEDMINEIGGDLLGHLSENKLKIFNLYREWARDPNNNDTPEELGKVMFLFGKPTPRILQILDLLYAENDARNEWFSSTTVNSSSNAFMLGIVETEDGQILMSISGDPSTTNSETNKLYENVYYHLFPMLNNIGFSVNEDDENDPDEIINNYARFKNDYKRNTQRLSTAVKKWGTPIEGALADLTLDEGEIKYVHNNRYLYGIRYVPFKREKKGQTNCNNGSSCVESKLFAYMHRNNLKPEGMVACWIGGNAKVGDPSTRHCMDSYTFCIKDGNERRRDAGTLQAKKDNKRVIGAMYKYLEKEVNTAFSGEDKFEKAERIMKNFAVPCPGCQMNEIRYKQGLPEIKWVNTDCSDIEKNKFVGGIESIEEETPGSSDWERRTSVLIEEEGGEQKLTGKIKQAIDEGGDTDPLTIEDLEEDELKNARNLKAKGEKRQNKSKKKK